MDPWVPREIPLTTFSIMMVNQTACGDLARVRRRDPGPRPAFSAGDRVLIAEACITTASPRTSGPCSCRTGSRPLMPGLEFDHAFGREFPAPEALKRYAVASIAGPA